MTTLLLSLTGLLILVTLLPLSRHRAWWIRGWEFPRLQLALACVTLALLVPVMTDEDDELRLWVVPVLLVLAGYHAWWIRPYTALARTEVPEATGEQGRLSLLTANVLMTNRQADALLTLVREHQPDLVVTLESDTWWERQLDTLSAAYPHTLKCPLDNLYGMHLYSRLPLHHAQIRHLVEDNRPSMHARVQLDNGASVRLHFLHPSPPSPTENETSSERDAELIVVARAVADESGPVVVAGDLNDVAWSHTTRLFRKLSGLLDPRIGRGMFNTFHADYPFARWPLDHLFHSRHFRLVQLRRLGHIGSDHFPLLTVLSCEGPEPAPDAGLSPDAEDLEDAREIAADQPTTPDQVPAP